MGVRAERQKLVDAFGHSKTIREWTEDRRCSVGYNVLSLRLLSGWDSETAIVTPYYEGPQFEAFGEWKTATEWAADPRCTVEIAALQSRLYRGWPMERSLTEPPRPKKKPKMPFERRQVIPGPHERVFEAFGALKSLKEWAEDPRCAVHYIILRDRLRKGWSLEDAITVKSGSGSALSTSQHVRGGIDPEKQVIRAEDVFEGFGVRKTIEEWVKDPRCKVAHRTIARRLKAGIPFEEAIKAHKTGGKPGPRVTYCAFGEFKTLGEWARDSRSAVPLSVLKTRLSRGMPPEAAVTTPEVQTRLFDAFGESKSLTDWLTDPRCAVGYTSLQKRLSAGWTFEDALTLPKRSKHLTG